MFKTNQKKLRFTEVPKDRPNTASEVIRGQSMEGMDRSDRKMWGSEDTSKEPGTFSRDTLPAWARSTVGMVTH